MQIDPLNICGRMHDLILRNRVQGYREGELMRHLHESTGPTTGETAPPQTPTTERATVERTAFEHHLPETHVLVAFPRDAWPYLLTAMRERSRQSSAWLGRLTPTERRLAPQLLAEIAARGPLSSEDFADRRRAHRVVWGAATLVKNTLQKLFFHGELLIAARNNHRRLYDLPERVLPRTVVSLPPATRADSQRWSAELKLRQRRLAALKREEVQLLGGAIVQVRIENCPALYCLKSDRPLLEECAPAAAETAPKHVRLLAPLDPLIYDRKLTERLWDFDYTWEAYTPAAKRVRGHYALPVLVGTELVGHVEPKADRKNGRLVVASRAIRRGFRTAEALDEFAAWLGLKR